MAWRNGTSVELHSRYKVWSWLLRKTRTSRASELENQRMRKSKTLPQRASIQDNDCLWKHTQRRSMPRLDHAAGLHITAISVPLSASAWRASCVQACFPQDRDTQTLLPFCRTWGKPPWALGFLLESSLLPIRRG